MQNPLRTLQLGAALLGCAAAMRADVALPHLFSDHMVLQCDRPVPVWGRGEPGEVVTAEFAGKQAQATTDGTGHWRLALERMRAGTSGALTIAGHNRLVIQDVLVGEVWLASGQSNMQLRVGEAANPGAAAAAADLPALRMFTVAQRPAVSAADDCEGRWVVCSADTVRTFSAAAFYFARELHTTRAVPVGIIAASWGATPIEAWTSPAAMAGHPELAPIYAAWDDPTRKAERGDAKPLRASKNYPGNLFNGMIAPLIPYALRGCIWYQGENNANSDHPELYARQLPLLIEDWRQRWNQGAFPFAWVQLPNFQPKNLPPNAPPKWPVVREAMRRSLAIPDTGMAVTIDIGDAENIHPKDKADVGHRLALWARARVYGEAIAFSGPLPADQRINGAEVIVTFAHADGGLVARGGKLVGFELAGADGRWVSADASIRGDQVIVTSPRLPAPRAVRYAWADNPTCTLFNGNGLPASPFRIDDGRD